MRKTITATLVTGLVSLMCLFSPAARARGIVSDHLKCYKVKCKGPAPSDQQTTDQFGTRTLSKLKAKLLCSPAFAGAPIASASSIPIREPACSATG